MKVIKKCLEIWGLFFIRNVNVQILYINQTQNCKCPANLGKYRRSGINEFDNKVLLIKSINQSSDYVLTKIVTEFLGKTKVAIFVVSDKKWL